MGELIDGAMQQAPQPARQGTEGLGRGSFTAYNVHIQEIVQMQTLSLSDFRAHVSEMLDLVERGETVRILRHGKAVAELVPVRPAAEEEQPAWKKPVEPIRYAKAPSQSGARMIIDEREQGW